MNDDFKGAPFECEIDSETNVATLTFPANTIRLDADHLEKAILWLAAVRMKLPRSPNPSYRPTQGRVMRVDPIPAKPEQAEEAGRALSIQTDPFGWISFPLTEADCRTLAEMLTGPVDRPLPPIIH